MLKYFYTNTGGRLLWILNKKNKWTTHHTKIEVADAIHDWKLDFFRGNVVKYVARAGHKDKSKELEDLKKAKWYLEYSIAILEKESARG